MKLYFSPTSPFVRKTLVVIQECDLIDAIEIVETTVRPAAPNREYGDTVSPLRQIPALETDDGEVLVDSLTIADYLIRRSGTSRLLPADGDRRTILLRNHQMINGLIERAVQTRYELSFRPEEMRWPEMIADNKDRILTGLSWIEERNEQFDGELTLASAALVAFVKYLDFRFDDWKWRNHVPGLAALGAKLEELPSVKAAYAIKPA
ncbi:MAG: glutathione S-transferase family protein [Pseudomonadota bacterium]